MHIMNDDLDAAEAGLTQGNSSFHKVYTILFKPNTAMADFERGTFADKIV